MKIEKLKEQFKKGKMIPKKDETIDIDGVKYRFTGSTSRPFADIIEGKLGMMMYSVSPESKDKFEQVRKSMEDTESTDSINKNLVFAWKSSKGTLHPLDFKFTTSGRVANDGLFEEDRKDNNIIGDIAEVKITNLPGSKTLKGRVDTGASLCSLHADNWKIENDQINFVCKELSDNVITVRKDNQQAVKTPDGGVEYRPVILLNIKINGKLLNDVQFNLNNRGHMDHPILIGQNALEKGKFLIDPLKNEEAEQAIDWDEISKLFEDSELDHIQESVSELNPERAEEVITMMLEADLSLRDIIQILNTKAANKKIEY